MIRLARLFSRDARGMALIEFALVAPILMLLLLGGLEVGHTMYVNGVLIGQMQKAGRDTTIEDANNPATLAAIEQNVTDAVHQVMGSAQVDFKLTSFHDYSNIDKLEKIIDVNGNGICDKAIPGVPNSGEYFIDANNDGLRDYASSDGRGGAKDAVMMTATVTYARLSLWRNLAMNPTVTLKSSTILRNQPSTDQATPPHVPCP